MDMELYGKIFLNPKSEYNSLYKWSLQEVDDNGAAGEHYIPWRFSLYFTATEINIIESIGAQDDGNPDSAMKVNVERRITATLVPGDVRDSSDRHNTVYSMFRTGRIISDFQLSIEPLNEVDQRRNGKVWGTVSYSIEIDFRDLVTPDTIVFYLYVDMDTFERLERKISASQIDQAVVRVGRVEGFYAEWSPEISTSFVKVLTEGSEHDVEIPEGCDVNPPRLGTLGEIQLYLRRANKLVERDLHFVDQR
ncbi:hypothetical protein [Mesorhizobium sp. M1E.F.Ca.ET.041.01.1.1]|uniref:hypothetical protein n=1 Tax=Mesorhizobium sp. M1E.F.Ca.ET.041.01.1.1 TaxID=2496759 RepID=UPI000FCC0FC8|nr:hypothetical protein [Mesorhizobium sp. M1E.F.Ca.ET.041.01.1.1]RUW30284.1 hypothetical protein EOA38_20825 [Mesorhizobium sp. M1E.F.Ca.ET.041.01.1.1]RWD92686.1 MAG: hypothetical protein EOS38_02340 [Mesorhizobium sp.]